MARKVTFYEPKVDEAIFTLLGAGCRDVEIRRMLAQDEAGIGYPVDMPERTYYDHKRKLLDARGKPALYAQQGHEVDIIEELSRRNLNLVGKELGRLQDKVDRGESLTKLELSKMRTAQRFLDEVHERRKAKTSTHQNGGSKGSRRASISSASMLANLTHNGAQDVAQGTVSDVEQVADEKQDEYEAQSNLGTRKHDHAPALVPA